MVYHKVKKEEDISLFLKKFWCLEVSFEAAPWLQMLLPLASCTMLLLSSASLEKDAWTANKMQRAKHVVLPARGVHEWLSPHKVRMAGSLWQAGTHSPLVKEAQGHGTPALVQHQPWWQHVNSGAACACGQRQEGDKTRTVWALRSQLNVLRGRNYPKSWPLSWNRTLLVASASCGLENDQDKLH